MVVDEVHLLQVPEILHLAAILCRTCRCVVLESHSNLSMDVCGSGNTASTSPVPCPKRSKLVSMPCHSDVTFQQKEFTVFDRLLLHSLHGDRPPVCLAARGKLNAVDTADWGGGGMSVEKHPRTMSTLVGHRS